MKKHFLLTDGELYGFKYIDLLGILVMFIPFIISIRFNKYDPAKYFLFIQIAPETNTNIRPGMISALFAAVFYASLIIRYNGIFRKDNLIEAIISSLRLFLNCWVLAALIAIALPANTTVAANDTLLKVIMSNWETTMLALALLLSWVGMRTLAGYSWILFLIAAWKRLLVVQSAMGMLGPVFAFTVVISLFLQISNYAVLGEFMHDFRGTAGKYGEGIKGDMRDAIQDAQTRVNDLASVAGGLIIESVEKKRDSK